MLSDGINYIVVTTHSQLFWEPCDTLLLVKIAFGHLVFSQSAKKTTIDQIFLVISPMVNLNCFQ